jgi:hypothetical protein
LFSFEGSYIFSYSLFFDFLIVSNKLPIKLETYVQNAMVKISYSNSSFLLLKEEIKDGVGCEQHLSPYLLIAHGKLDLRAFLAPGKAKHSPCHGHVAQECSFHSRHLAPVAANPQPKLFVI